MLVHFTPFQQKGQDLDFLLFLYYYMGIKFYLRTFNFTILVILVC